jgi:hypothetical protein
VKKITRAFIAFLFLMPIFWFSISHWRGANRQSPENDAMIGTNVSGRQVTRPSKPEPIGLIRQIGSNIGISRHPTKESAYREGLGTLNHVPIEYYGLVVDETGKPLPGALVKWSVAYKNGLQEGYKTGEVTADAQGRFSIKGESGKSLNVYPERAGYRFVATNGGAIYSHLWSAEQRYSPDPTNPVRLTMWKIRAGEKLLRLDRQFKASANQMPIFVNLVQGTITEKDADIKLTVVRPPGTLSKQHPADWSLQIEAVGGGLVRVPFDVYRTTFEAPESDYQPLWQVKMSAVDREWFESIRETFFVKSKDGAVHGKVLISFHINSKETDPVVFVIQAVINASHSRNWEEGAEVTGIGH